MKRRVLSRFNPFRNDGTPLPPNVLMAAKLVVLILIIEGTVGGYPMPGLPLLPLFEPLTDAVWFRVVMIGLFYAAAGALLLNQRVRAAAAVCAVVMLSIPLVARTSYSNGKFFCGAMLMLIALYQPATGVWFIRAQFAVMYFGSALNKLLEPDWHDGVYMHHWLLHMRGSELYGVLSPLLPPMAFATAMGWGVIVGEFALAAGFLVPRLTRAAIWLAVLLHTGSVLFAGHTFNEFFAALLAAVLTVVAWPRHHGAEMRYDPVDPIARTMRRLSPWTHPDRPIRGVRSPGSDPMRLSIAGRIYRNLAALNIVVLLSPVTLFAVLLLITRTSRIERELFLVVALVWFFPLTPWLADRVAQWIGRVASSRSTQGAPPTGEPPTVHP